MKTLAALLDLPGHSQFTRIRLIVRDVQGALWTSGTTDNKQMTEHELEELQAQGFALRWEGRFAPLQVVGGNNVPLQNPAGFWMGKEVMSLHERLSPSQRFSLPPHPWRREVSQPPWEGQFWLEEPATIQHLRREWVELLARHAVQTSGDERARLWKLMLATLPSHDMTRAVHLLALAPGDVLLWLKRQLATEGKRFNDEQLSTYAEQLIQQLRQLALRQGVRRERRSSVGLRGGSPRPLFNAAADA